MRMLYLPFWFLSIAQWYRFPDMLLLVDIMLLNFPFPPEPANAPEPAE
jgi:hypothetical protein